MALIHDDVMDDDAVRRGEPTRPRRAGRPPRRAAGRLGPTCVGTGIAIVAGDLAAVFADQLFSGAGFAPDRLAGRGRGTTGCGWSWRRGAYLDLVDGRRRRRTRSRT